MTRFWKCEAGATSIEYALIASIVSIAIIGGLQMFGPKLNTTFNSVGSTLR